MHMCVVGKTQRLPDENAEMLTILEPRENPCTLSDKSRRSKLSESARRNSTTYHTPRGFRPHPRHAVGLAIARRMRACISTF